MLLNPRLFEFSPHSKLLVHGECCVSVVIPMDRCPHCNVRCHFRRGVHFDHERICHTCSLTWEPESWYFLVRDLPEDKRPKLKVQHDTNLERKGYISLPTPSATKRDSNKS